MDAIDKEIIKKIYILNIMEDKRLKIYNEYPLNLFSKQFINKKINDLLKNGYLIKKNNSVILSETGRRVITVGLTGGTFDILHIGHVTTLKEAKSMVDILAVVVARDKTVYRHKERYPLNNEVMRLELLNSLKPVDIAILGDEEDFLKPVKKIKPDIIFLGYDQSLPEEVANKIPKNIKIIHLQTEVRGLKTSKILKRLREIFNI